MKKFFLLSILLLSVYVKAAESISTDSPYEKIPAEDLQAYKDAVLSFIYRNDNELCKRTLGNSTFKEQFTEILKTADAGYKNKKDGQPLLTFTKEYSNGDLVVIHYATNDDYSKLVESTYSAFNRIATDLRYPKKREPVEFLRYVCRANW